MGRKKVKLAYIACNSKRKETFRKRKNGILKKAKEISVLCGIEACVIIYENRNSQAEVWPSNSIVKSVVSKFRSYPELERSKKMMDQEAFLRQSIAKVYDQLKKLRDETRKIEMFNLVGNYIQSGEFNCNLMSKNDLNNFSSYIDENLKEVNRKIQGMPIESVEERRNGGEAVNGVEGLQNNGYVPQGIEMNMDDAMQINFEQWPMEFNSMLPFSYANYDQNGF